MSVADLEQAIRRLTPEQLTQLRAWFAEYDAEMWDRQIEDDAAAGRLDALLEEASREYHAGRTLDPPTAANDPVTKTPPVREAS